MSIAFITPVASRIRTKMDSNKDIAIQKIMEMSQEQVSKVLIFMAGMEAESTMHNGTQEI